MQGCEPERRDAQSIGHPRIAAVMNLPPAPEGEDGGHDHQNSAYRIHGNLSMLLKGSLSGLTLMPLNPYR